MTKPSIPNDKQYLSDLLDDQVSSGAIDQLLDDKQNPKAWYRFHLVRAVLRNQHSAHVSFEFSQSIAQLIENEPSYAGDHNRSDNVEHSNVVPFLRRAFWKKTGSGLAIAASVAFVMIFSVQMLEQPPQQSPANGAEFAQSSGQSSNPLMAPATMSASPSNATAYELNQRNAEQARLDDIQRILNQINRQDFNVTEELVSGEFMVQSYVIKAQQSVTPFEEKIRRMKRPSEVVKNK